jgi:hypothetical protein
VYRYTHRKYFRAVISYFNVSVNERLVASFENEDVWEELERAAESRVVMEPSRECGVWEGSGHAGRRQEWRKRYRQEDLAFSGFAQATCLPLNSP